jgi:hypothetical protein
MSSFICSYCSQQFSLLKNKRRHEAKQHPDIYLESESKLKISKTQQCQISSESKLNDVIFDLKIDEATITASTERNQSNDIDLRDDITLEENCNNIDLDLEVEEKSDVNESKKNSSENKKKNKNNNIKNNNYSIDYELKLMNNDSDDSISFLSSESYESEVGDLDYLNESFDLFYTRDNDIEFDQINNNDRQNNRCNHDKTNKSENDFRPFSNLEEFLFSLWVETSQIPYSKVEKLLQILHLPNFNISNLPKSVYRFKSIHKKLPILQPSNN